MPKGIAKHPLKAPLNPLKTIPQMASPGFLLARPSVLILTQGIRGGCQKTETTFGARRNDFFMPNIS